MSINPQRPWIALLHGIVGAATLALVVQTWVCIGLVRPAYVAGASMAPAAPDGDRLLVDRVAAASPRRWQTAVFVSPIDARLNVKRIVGLPGETIDLAEGDLFVDGRRYVKTLAQQRRMRVPIDHAGSWRRDADKWLVFQTDGPLTDRLAANAERSLRLYPVADLMLSAEVRWGDGGRMRLRIERGGEPLNLTLTTSGTLELLGGNGSAQQRRVSGETRRRLASGRFLLEVSTFDRQLLAAIDGRVELCRPLERIESGVAANRPFALRVEGGEAPLARLAVYRDLYYRKQPADSRAAIGPTRLGRNEYFVLGDNSAVSIDSRIWGPLPKRLVVGRPIGVP